MFAESGLAALRCLGQLGQRHRGVLKSILLFGSRRYSIGSPGHMCLFLLAAVLLNRHKSPSLSSHGREQILSLPAGQLKFGKQRILYILRTLPYIAGNPVLLSRCASIALQPSRSNQMAMSAGFAALHCPMRWAVMVCGLQARLPICHYYCGMILQLGQSQDLSNHKCSCQAAPGVRLAFRFVDGP